MRMMCYNTISRAIMISNQLISACLLLFTSMQESSSQCPLWQLQSEAKALVIKFNILLLILSHLEPF